MVFCCNRLALVWFHHSFIFHFPLFRLHFHSNSSMSQPAAVNRSKTGSVTFSVTPQRSHITETASEANVSPAPANLNSGCISTDVDLLLLSPPQFLPPNRTLKWTWRCLGWLGESTRSGVSLRTQSQRAKSYFTKVSHPFCHAKGEGAGQPGGLEAGANGPSIRNLKSWPLSRSQPEYINSGTLRRSG